MPQPASSLALSSRPIRLEALEKEHQWLLKQIRKKQTELKNFVEQMRSLATEIFQRGAPSFKKLGLLDQEIHNLFEEIFNKKKFGKKKLKDIEAVYRNLQLAGIISTKLDNEEEDAELDELFESNEEENNFSNSHTEEQHQHQEAQKEGGFPFGSRTEISKNIRQTFLRLAEIFHPDKVTDTETQMRHTEIMKEINKAYQEGDLARLLEIERQHQKGESIESNNEDYLTRKYDRLEQENEFLKTQYENLKRELRLVKNSPEGAMVSNYRKAKREGIDPVAEMIEQVESEISVISEIRDFVKNFKEEKMSVKEFLRGPAILRQMSQETIEDFLEQMFSEMDEEI